MSHNSETDFAKLVGRVEPIKRPDIAPGFSRPPKKQLKRKPCQRDNMHYRAQETLYHNFERISGTLFRQMRMGKVHCSDHFDLHGMLVNEAVNYLKNAFELRRNRHLVCWQIIHGKGRRSPDYDRAPLKHAILEILLNHPAVAAIASVIDSDGASGAVIIAVMPKDR